MREIKFRAWVNEDDPEYSRMVKSEQAITTILSHKYGGNGVARPAGFSDIDNQPKPERYILMQYTGLKDKNGKEIYEGDIVQLTVPERPYLIQGNGYIDEGFSLKGTVKFIHNCWFLEESNEKGCPLNFEEGQTLEVIGNVYDNPALLEVQHE